MARHNCPEASSTCISTRSQPGQGTTASSKAIPCGTCCHVWQWQYTGSCIGRGGGWELRYVHAANLRLADGTAHLCMSRGICLQPKHCKSQQGSANVCASPTSTEPQQGASCHQLSQNATSAIEPFTQEQQHMPIKQACRIEVDLRPCS